MGHENPDRDEDDGTPGYLGGTDGYPSSERGPADSAESADEARKALRTESEWWERAGYESLADALADEAAMSDRVWGREPRDLRGLSLKEVLFSKPERPSRSRHQERTRSRQVNVKLTEAEHAQLQEAARGYGLAPSTLARVFVVRATDLALKQLST
jgi:hypothetical protein